MKVKLDENLPRAALDLFRTVGADASSVHDQGLVGRPDDHIAEVCRSERRTIVTLDLDFSDIRSFPPRAYAGIIVLRPKTSSKRAVVLLLDAFLSEHAQQSFDGRLFIVSPDRVRVHPAM